MFEDDVCVAPLGFLEGRRNNANITFLRLFVGPCTGRLEVIDKGLDYAAAFFQVSMLGLGAPLC